MVPFGQPLETATFEQVVGQQPEMAYEFPNPEQDTGVEGSIVLTEPKPVLSPIIEQARAEKYNFALGDNSPGTDKIKEIIRADSEEYWRISLVGDAKLRSARLRQQLVSDYIANRPIKGEPVSPAEVDFINKLSDPQIDQLAKDPQTFLEKAYGTAVIDTSTILSTVSAYDRYLEENPDRADAIAISGANMIAKTEGIKRIREDLQAKWKQAGWGPGVIMDYVETVTPGLSWYNMQNAIKGAPKGSFLLGNNLEEQIAHFYSLPMEEGLPLLKATVEEMAKGNAVDAIQYLDMFIAGTRSDQFLANTMSVLDILTPVPLTAFTHPIKAAKSATSKSVAMASAIKDVVKAATQPNATAADILSASGATELAAKQHLAKTLATLQNEAAVSGSQVTWKDLIGKVTLGANPSAWLDGGQLAKDANFITKVENVLAKAGAKLLDAAFTDPIQIQRLVPGTPAWDVAVEEAIAKVKISSTHVGDNILYHMPAEEDRIANTYAVKMYIGWYGGLSFKTPEQATMFAKRFYNFENFNVVPNANGHVIEITRFLDETTPGVNRAMMQTGGPTPSTMSSHLIGFLKTPDELVDKGTDTSRKVATYGSSALLTLTRDMANEIRASLSKGQLKDLTEFLSRQRDYRDPTTGDRGTFSSTISRFEQDYNTVFNRLPSEAEALAYARMLQLNDLDYIVRSTSNFRNKVSAGLENIKLYHQDYLDKLPPIEGKVLTSDPFERGQGFTFLVWDGRIGHREFKRKLSWRIGKKDGKPDSEFVPIQVTRDGYKAFRESLPEGLTIPRTPVDVIYVKKFKTENIPINQVPYKPGGHVRIKDGFVISQPEFKQNTFQGLDVSTYIGDINLAHFTKETDAQALTSAFERGRQLLREEMSKPSPNYTALSKHLANELPGLHDVDSFIKLFRGRNSKFDIDSPFLLRPVGKTTEQTTNLSTFVPRYKKGKEDLFRLESSWQDPAYLKERSASGLETIAWDGSSHSPVLKYQPAELVDPLETLSDAVHSVMRGRYMDDVRVQSARRFITEFAHVLDHTTEDMLSNPFKFLMDPTFKQGADSVQVSSAKNLRRVTLDFLGMRSPLEKELSYVQRKMHDAIYSTVGKDGLAKVEKGKELLDTLSAGATKDPVKFLRGFAFHTKMGFFNVRQLVMQAMGAAHSMSIAGATKTFDALPMYTVMRAMLVNDNAPIVKKLTEIGAKMGWSKDQILESFQGLKRSGFANIGGEHAFVDDLTTPSVMQTSMGKALDDMTFFFKEGERFNRILAWNIAYREWRTANPKSLMDDQVLADILRRSDILTNNMSRASNASWQTGIPGVPTQFMSYQARITELFMGKRLTPDEKIRLLTTNAILFGLPTATAIGTGAGLLYPIQEVWRGELVKRGVNYDEGVITRFLGEGMVGFANQILAGGERQNFVESMAPHGLSVVKNLFDPNKGVADVLMGVGGTSFWQFVKSTEPLAASIMNVFSADGGHKLAAEDFTDVLSNISTVNNALKGLYAYSAQMYVNKQGGKLSAGEVSAYQALLTGFVGLTPQTISDGYLMLSKLRGDQATANTIRKEIVRNIRIGLNSQSMEDAEKYMRRAQVHFQAGETAGVFSPREYNRILKEVGGDSLSQVDSIAWKYAQTSEKRMKALIDSKEKGKAQ